MCRSGNFIFSTTSRGTSRLPDLPSRPKFREEGLAGSRTLGITATGCARGDTYGLFCRFDSRGSSPLVKRGEGVS